MTTLDDLICIVDDDTSVLRALKRLLLSKGFSARSFLSPLEFIEYAKSHLVRVVILDLNMPEMSGLEVFAWLRSSSPDSRIIVLSGNDDPSCRVTVLSHGAAAFFPKPLADDAFVSCVRDVSAHFSN